MSEKRKPFFFILKYYSCVIFLFQGYYINWDQETFLISCMVLTFPIHASTENVLVFVILTVYMAVFH